MATVAALFGTGAEATEALDALSDTPYAEVDLRVYEDETANNVVAVVPAGASRLGDGGPLAGSAVLIGFGDHFTDLDEGDVTDYLAESVANGATLVVAEVDDDKARGLAAFFDEHGGRVALDT